MLERKFYKFPELKGRIKFGNKPENEISLIGQFGCKQLCLFVLFFNKLIICQIVCGG